MRANKFNNLTTGYGLSRFSSINPHQLKPHNRQMSGIIGHNITKNKGNMMKAQNACFNLVVHEDGDNPNTKIRKMSMGYQNFISHSRSASAFLKIRK